MFLRRDNWMLGLKNIASRRESYGKIERNDFFAISSVHSVRPRDRSFVSNCGSRIIRNSGETFPKMVVTFR